MTNVIIIPVEDKNMQPRIRISSNDDDASDLAFGSTDEACAWIDDQKHGTIAVIAQISEERMMLDRRMDMAQRELRELQQTGRELIPHL